MWQPMQPNLGQGDDGIPAADAGPGAPAAAEGFGTGGEEPDPPEQSSSGSGGPPADPASGAPPS